MTENIEEGFMAFLGDGQEGIGAVREVNDTSIVIYIENAGEFVVPRTAVKDSLPEGDPAARSAR